MRMARQPGVRDAAVLMATEANRRTLAAQGYAGDALDSAGPNDLAIAIDGEETAVESILANPDTWFDSRVAGAVGADGIGMRAAREPHTIEEAAIERPDAGIAVISVPGEHAAREARAALKRGLHVFLFSSNVSIEEELSLKTEARGKALIVMGPDCGTAFIGGAGIGFANKVRRGQIGVVASSGTGLQEFSCLVHEAGYGISHGIGTGSRDLSDAIGGISTLMGIEALDADPGSKVIALLSKPPGQATMIRVLDRLSACRKPVVVCLFGAASPTKSGRSIGFASTIDEAVRLSIEAAGCAPPGSLRPDMPALRKLAAREAARMTGRQKFIRGIFAGGTFCFQCQALMREAGLVVHANSPIPGVLPLADPSKSDAHSMVDMGAEAFVEGRPHPMIDATLRRERIRMEGRDPEVALLLLDFILGAISSADPVGDVIEAIAEAKVSAVSRGGHLCVAASVCGTAEDDQGLDAAVRALEKAGVLVFPSNAQAALFSRELALLLPRT